MGIIQDWAGVEQEAPLFTHTITINNISERINKSDVEKKKKKALETHKDDALLCSPPTADLADLILCSCTSSV